MTSRSGARAQFRLLFLLAAGLVAPIAAAYAQAPSASPSQAPAPAPVQTPAPAPQGQCYAVLIGGINGQEAYGKWYADWLARFQAWLTQSAHLSPSNVTLLLGKDATFTAVTDAFGKFARRATPRDQLILFIVGHGELSGTTATLMLAGPDPTADQFAALLNAFPSKNQVILNLSASSGDFLKALSAPNRVNITATSPTEVQEPVFAEFFLRGLESKRANGGKSAPINMLDAFNWAAQQTAWWIGRWTMTSNPHDITASTWQGNGKETVEIFKKLYSDLPGRTLDPASDGTVADAPVDLVPPGGEITGDWGLRRVVDEHALLEDCGQGIGVSEIGDKGIQPILGQKPGDPGCLAAHTVLGQAALLSP